MLQSFTYNMPLACLTFVSLVSCVLYSLWDMNYLLRRFYNTNRVNIIHVLLLTLSHPCHICLFVFKSRTIQLPSPISQNYHPFSMAFLFPLCLDVVHKNDYVIQQLNRFYTQLIEVCHTIIYPIIPIVIILFFTENESKQY